MIKNYNVNVTISMDASLEYDDNNIREDIIRKDIIDKISKCIKHEFHDEYICDLYIEEV